MSAAQEQEARAFLEALEPLLEPLSRLARSLERDLVAVERAYPIHEVRQPLMERLSEAWSQPGRLHPVRDAFNTPHLRTRPWASLSEAERAQRPVVGFRILALSERRAQASLDTAPNRVLAHGLHQAARRLEGWMRQGSALDPSLASRTQQARDRLRAIQARAFAEQRPGAMRPADLLHRSLRGARYRPTRLLWQALRR